MFDDYDVDAWKRKKEPETVCPQCEELNLTSYMFPVDGRRLHTIIPSIHFFDEIGVFHEHHDSLIKFLRCSRGHFCKIIYDTYCWGCAQRAQLGWKEYERDSDRAPFIIVAITNPHDISLLCDDSYMLEDGKIKYLEVPNDNNSR